MVLFFAFFKLVLSSNLKPLQTFNHVIDLFLLSDFREFKNKEKMSLPAKTQNFDPANISEFTVHPEHSDTCF